MLPETSGRASRVRVPFTGSGRERNKKALRKSGRGSPRALGRQGKKAPVFSPEAVEGIRFRAGFARERPRVKSGRRAGPMPGRSFVTDEGCRGR